MKRTTIYLEPDLEVRLRAEARVRGVAMADIVREALREKFAREQRAARSPHAGAFASGRSDVASGVDEVLDDTGFGDR